MKKTLSYKSKRNIIIASVIVVLLAIISTTGFLYIKNNDKEAKAFTQENTINGEQITNDTNQIEQGENTTNNQNVENQIQNNENNQNENQAISLNEQTNTNNQNQQEQTNANQNNQTPQQTNQNQSTTNNNGTPNQTTGELPEQEFITEEIVEQDVLVSEDFMVEWVPANIQANVTTENLEIIRPIFVAIKKADKTVVEKDGTITYTISVLNIGNIEGTAIIKDSIDQKTEFIADSIEINDDKTEYTQKDLENGNIKVNIPVKGLVKLSFKVKAVQQLEADEKIENMAYVNDKPTNKVVVDMPNIQVEKTVFMKNYEEIPQEELDTVTFDKGDIAGYKIKVTNTGTIKLNNVTLVDILENKNQIFLDENKPEEKTNTILDYDEELSLEPNEYKEYIVYYEVEEDDVKNVSEKDSLKNNVTATGYYTTDEGEIMPVKDEDDEKIKFEPKPDISIVKTQKVGTEKLDEKGCVNGKQKELKPGDIIDYTITIENEGNTKLTGVVVTDIMSNNPTGGTRNVTIDTVKIEGKTRNYTVNNNGSLNIDGVLDVGEILVITASYKVVESDMSDKKVETIKNTATVVTNETAQKDSSVETKTLIYKPEITISKTGKLADGVTDANEKTLKYGDTVTYILKAENNGTKYGTVTIKDEDIKTLVNAGNVQITSDVEVAHFNDKDGSEKTVTITENKIKALAEDGIEVYVPAGKSATVTFTVKITAAPGTTIKNTVVNGTGTVTNYVEKQVTAVSSSQKDKNIVIVLDLSDTMLYTENQTEMADVYEGYDADPIGCIENLNKKTNTKLAKAKAAVKQLVNNVLTKNPNNTITIRTFNYSSYQEALDCCAGITTYTKAITKCSDVYKKFIGINKEITQSGDKDTINALIDSIKVTHLANTNVVAAMEETKKVVNELAKDETRDVEVIFIGDGKPTFSTEGCAIGKYYDKDTTLNKIAKLATDIRKNAKFYTISYGTMKDSEQAIANQVFTSMATTGPDYMQTGNDISKMLTKIGNSITSTPTTSTKYTDKNNGTVQFKLDSKQTLNIGENTPVTLTITLEGGIAQKYTFSSRIADINKIGNGVNTNSKQVIYYDKNNKTFTIYAQNIDASASISLRYYYSTSN